MPRPSAKDRARAWITKAAPAAIQGSRGDDATFAVACTLVIDFGLSDGDAAELMGEYNRTKCSPAWSDHDLEVKLRSARKLAASKPGDIGRLIDQDRRDYSGPRPAGNAAPYIAASTVEAHVQTQAPAQAPPVTPVATPARTVRTVAFRVRRFGEGAEPGTLRTVRTLPANPLRIDFSSPVYVRNGEEVSEPSVVVPKVYAKPAEEVLEAVQAGAAGSVGAAEPSGPVVASFAGKQSVPGNLGAAVAALAQDGVKAGHVVTWVGAGGNIVRFGRDGRPRKFGTVKA